MVTGLKQWMHSERPTSRTYLRTLLSLVTWRRSNAEACLELHQSASRVGLGAESGRLKQGSALSMSSWYLARKYLFVLFET